MLIAFFDVISVAHMDFLPQGQKINQHICKTILQRLTQFLPKNNVTVLDQPPYAPDLAPCNFFLFLKLKKSYQRNAF